MSARHRFTGAAILVLAAPPTIALAEVSVTTARTEGVATATADNGSPADVSISTAGSIALSGGAGLVVNSDNTATNAGAITSTDASNVTGVLISGTRVSTILNSGSISFLDSLTVTDSDGDGDYDTVFATGSGRTGILLDAGGTLTGSISNTGAITIEGNDSFGIRLRGPLDGSLSNTGSISVQGDRVIALSLEGDVSGDVISSGAVVATGLDATGISITGDVNGRLRIASSVTTTGYRYVYRSSSATTLAALDADDLLQGGSALRVQASLAHGLEIAGIGVEDDDDDDDDGDGLLDDIDGDGVVDDDDDADDDQTATLATYGAAPTVLVSSTLASGPLSLGAAQEGFGFVNRGSVYAYGVYDGVSATAIRIEGLAGAPVVIAGGVLNDRSIVSTAYEADATALSIGDYVSAPAIVNRGSIVAGVTGENAGVAYGVVLSADADTDSFVNTGRISAAGTGATAGAYAILDRSGGLVSILNTGSITAAVDDDGGSAAGQAVAIDVSANVSGVVLTQSAPSVFTDLDSTDDVANADTQIIGDILFGAGADTFGVYAGTVTGDVNFGAGADIFVLENASYAGRLQDADGQLSITVTNADMSLDAGTLALTSATFGSGAVLSVTLSETGGTYLDASGSVIFSDGASIVALVPTSLPDSGDFVFLRAQNLIGASHVIGPAGSGAAPYLYDLSIEVSSGDANALQASYVRKTAADLGLNLNEIAIYEPLIAALRQDADASAAMVSLMSKASFEAAYADLMPTFTTAASDLSQAALDTQQKTVIDRAASRRDARHENYWLQEIGYGVQRTASGASPGYSGGGFGFAAGIDGPLMNGGLFGLSVAFTTSSSNEDSRASTDEISNSFGQVNAYWAFTTGPLTWTALAGGGGGKASSVRGVSIGDDYETELTASWSIAEGHATLVAEAPLKLLEGIELAPRVGLSYLGMWEGARSETGGVMGVESDDAWTQRLRGELGVQMSFDGGMNGAPVRSHVYGGWRQDLLDQDVARELRFVGGGATFTVTDEAAGEGGVVAGAGVDFLGDWISFGLSVEGEFRDGYAREGVNATARIRF